MQPHLRFLPSDFALRQHVRLYRVSSRDLRVISKMSGSIGVSSVHPVQGALRTCPSCTCVCWHIRGGPGSIESLTGASRPRPGGGGLRSTLKKLFYVRKTVKNSKCACSWPILFMPRCRVDQASLLHCVQGELIRLATDPCPPRALQISSVHPVTFAAAVVTHKSVWISNKRVAL